MRALIGPRRRGHAFLGLLFALALVGIDAAHGQQAEPPAPDRLVAAKRLMEMSGAAKQFDDVIPRVLGQMQGHIARRNPTEAQLVRDVFARVSERMIRDKGELLDEIARFYAERLTVAEMDEIVRFYQSAAGAKLISLTPDLAQRTLEITQKWVGKLTGEMQQEVEAERKRRREGEGKK